MTYSYWNGAHGIPVVYDREHRSHRIDAYVIALVCLAVVVVFGVAVAKIFTGLEEVPSAPVQTAAVSTAPPQVTAVVAELPTFDREKVASTVNAWASSGKGTKGVVIADAEGKVLAASGGDEQFFMASIYKVYVAYVGYQEIDAGVHTLDEPYLNGWTRGKCLDEMVRNSDSPCAEKMMSELGRQNIQNKLQAYGLANTLIRGLTTSSGDVSIILSRLWKGTDLSAGSRQQMLDSMLGQKYRNGLPNGFQGSTVYNKVGFRDEVEYHDVGIVKMADGRELIVSVLTRDTGVSNISKLASSLSKL